MKIIEGALEPITGYLLSITRNTINGWYELEIGIPNNWVFNDSAEISCEVLKESDAGKLIKISPKQFDVVIDDLVTFVVIIINTNQRIAEKEKHFTDEMQEMKNLIEEKAKNFYKELDELKDNSFKSFSENVVKISPRNEEKKSKKKQSIKNLDEPSTISAVNS